MPNYAHDDNNNRIETLSKEEIYALLAAAIQQGQLPILEQDTAFVTMLKSILDGKAYKVAFCTQAQYNELEAEELLEADTYYFITDDTSYDDIVETIDNILVDINNLDSRVTTLESKRVTGSITYSSSSSTLMSLIETHPNVRFWINYTTTVGAVTIVNIMSVNFMASYSTAGTLTISAYYADGSSISDGETLYYEYFK